MGIGVSLLLIAIGAILKWGVTYQVNGVELSTIGVILMVVGAIGLVLTMIMLTARRRTDVVHETDGAVVDAADPATGRTVSRTTYVRPTGYDPTA